MPQLQYSKVNNAIITLTDTDDSTKGKHFKSRFIQPGLAGYPGQFGNALIKKENLDRFVHTLRNKPVTINHRDKITEDDKKGEVFNVWFNPEDGWYWCDGIITDDEAINLINSGWSVSCAYDFTKADNSGGTENNIPYDIEFLDGEFNHLALVDNPRYEGANIVFNSKVKNTFEGHEGREGKVGGSLPKSYYNKETKLSGVELGTTENEIRENAISYYKKHFQGNKYNNPELKGILFSRVGIDKFKANSADIEKVKAIPALKDIIEHGKYQGPEDLEHPREDGIVKFHRINHNVKIGNTNTENMSILIAEDKNGNRFYNLNPKTYKINNSPRVIHAKGEANEELSINIIPHIENNLTPDVKELEETSKLKELKAQNSLTDTILNAIAELITGE